MADTPGNEATVTAAEVELVPSREYELAVVATATIEGPAGGVCIRRRYEALPRHNDVVDPGSVDSNDELVDRSDAVHVYTQYYSARDGSYLLDSHDTWIPDGLSVFEDPEGFLAASRDHHVGNAGRAYARATAEA